MTVSLNLSESEKVAKIERFGFDRAPTWGENLALSAIRASAAMVGFAKAWKKAKS